MVWAVASTGRRVARARESFIVRLVSLCWLGGKLVLFESQSLDHRSYTLQPSADCYRSEISRDDLLCSILCFLGAMSSRHQLAESGLHMAADMHPRFADRLQQSVQLLARVLASGQAIPFSGVIVVSFHDMDSANAILWWAGLNKPCVYPDIVSVGAVCSPGRGSEIYEMRCTDAIA